MDGFKDFWPLLGATIGPIFTVGVVWATFQRLKQDVADHQRRDDEHFNRLYETLGTIRERLSAIDGGPYHQ